MDPFEVFTFILAFVFVFVLEENHITSSFRGSFYIYCNSFTSKVPIKNFYTQRLHSSGALGNDGGVVIVQGECHESLGK